MRQPSTLVRISSLLFAIGTATLVVIVAMSVWLAARTSDYADDVLETQQARARTSGLQALLADAETSQRGYLLTGDRAYLEPYSAVAERIAGEMRELRRLLEEDVQRASGVDRLSSLVSDKLAELEGTIALADAGRTAEALAVVRTDRGRLLMAEIRETLRRMLAELDIRMATRVAAVDTNGAALVWVTVTGALLILGVAGGAIWMVARHTRALARARAEVEALNADLDERVRERTSDLARANEEIQRFAYIVSHDLRSPLVNVMGFTSEMEAGMQVLQRRYETTDPGEDDPARAEARRVVTEDLPEAIGFIRSSTSRMDRLINAILKLSREGRRTITPERIDMAALLTNAAGSVQHQLAETHGRIDVVDPIPDIVSDRLALEQVFGNLVDNAVKYLDRGRPGRIVIRGRRGARETVYEVEDNGRGIAPQDQERIFELFRRAGAQDRPGEGIGLAHVRALVRRLGGDITVQSVLGSGTTFRVSLPPRPPTQATRAET
ncbi:MAG: CHASE3 domain-containing protein [Alphaproteobacteria bacterium]